ncbi:hypothetical protein DCAR_0311478 [Daucus carota subsp. sativus]|uniref:SWIM-type domain-containing protein n=1 Tax=Daucus carota subsp. sativus TaxID=79200 RepID=A0AAF0WQB8_DAUCS|nr:PREDICTED: protein FAR-RED IMPAIRED RESPONSE 1-like [Daucus carota subsp. sativus]WOG92215.1 hypothetical protein DCAR_0311478 [Daucus carota subsp. sativus]
MHFPTLEDAYLYYKEYGRQGGFDVRKSTKKTDRYGNILAKYMQCSRGGNPYANKLRDSSGNYVEGPSRRTSSQRCFCRAQIILKPAAIRGFVIMGFEEEHNHPLATGRNKMFLRCNRNVSVAYQDFIVDFGRANIGPTRAHSLVKEMTGSYDNVGATISDFKNFSRDVKVRIEAKDTDQLLSKFKTRRASPDEGFYYDYKLDKKGRLSGLFWTDVIGRANYDAYGDMISFDPTFRTNRFHMVFVPFTGVDNHWKNVTFAAGLLAKENYKNFKWLLTSFKKAMGRAPTTVITDQCKAIKKAISKWWSSSRHRLCMWHIMAKFPSKIGPKLASNKKFVSKLKDAVYSDHLTPVQFEERWEAVIAEFNLVLNPWLSKMFSICAQWIPAYFSDIEMAGLLRTTSRSESSNFYFQHFHDSGDTLVEFWSSFESAMDRQRMRNADDEKKSQKIPLTDITLANESDAANLYTLELFYLVREEIKSGCYHTIVESMFRDDDCSHFKFKDVLLNDQVFEVSLRHCDNHVICSCKFYFRRGYLCRHSFAALHQCCVKTIPHQFLKARWTKNALQEHSFLGSNHVDAEYDNKERRKLKRTRAWFEFKSLINIAWDNEEKVDEILGTMKKMNNSFSESTRAQTNNVVAHRADRFIPPAEINELRQSDLVASSD